MSNSTAQFSSLHFTFVRFFKTTVRRGYWILPVLLYLFSVLNSPTVEGIDLFPFPDAQEYALLAERLASGEPPLLGIGLHDYPSRYPLSFPLVLAPFVALGMGINQLYWISILFGVGIAALMTRTGHWMLGSRWIGAVAACFWALHPQTMDISTVVMSENAILFGFFLSLGLARPWLSNRPHVPGRFPILRALAAGMLVGWLTLMKAPFVYWALTLTILLLFDGSRSRRWGPVVALVLGGGLCYFADGLYRVWAFGDWEFNGYQYWHPNIYGDFGRIFNLDYLLTPYSPSSLGGNLVYYGRMVAGLTHDFYAPYMGVSAFAALICLAWPWRRGRPNWRVTGLMTGWALVGITFCGTYFFQSQRFPYLWIPLIDGLVAWGLIRGPLWKPLRRFRLPMTRIRLCRLAQIVGVFVIFILLRGEYRRVHAMHHLSPAHDEFPLAHQIRGMLETVPEEAWIFTNFQAPLVEHYRPSAGPTGGIYVYFIDAPLMNGHLFGIWSFNLTPVRLRPQYMTWLDTIPDAWRDGPTLLIGPSGEWMLTPGEVDQIWQRPVYFLVYQPPVIQLSGVYWRDEIKPTLERRLRLKPIQRRQNLTLYLVENRPRRELQPIP